MPEPSPEAPAAQFRYFLTAGGILLGTGEPGAALLALAEAGDVTEIGAGQARELVTARNGGTG